MFFPQPIPAAQPPVVVYVALSAPLHPPPFPQHYGYPYPLLPTPHGYSVPSPAPAYSPAFAALPQALPSPQPPAPKKEKETKDSAPKDPRPVASTLPAPLLSMMRNEGPYLANEVFSRVPEQALEAIPEETPAPEWYAITRGRFVGVVDDALCDYAITGVAHAARKAYDTQEQALTAFNKALTWGGVQVV
ncbi:hypothetical protein R3P38DRAFT_3190081 [Favolaschia claudopus]|uniref:Uncharacterized protein n=1 Tax=Favolaschia claudopus TaxID=2862362 RepID=A0AAW0BQC2_9AGAR